MAFKAAGWALIYIDIAFEFCFNFSESFTAHNITEAKTYKNKLNDSCTAERVEDEKTASPVITNKKEIEIETIYILNYTTRRVKKKTQNGNYHIPFSYYYYYIPYIAWQLLCRNSIPVFPCIICKSQ